MRPPKRVLLIDPDEERQGIMRFLLRTFRFVVLSASTAAEARGILGEASPDVILAQRFEGVETLLEELHRANPYVPQVLLAGSRLAYTAVADMVLYNPPATELIERLRIISARKRGPRPAKPIASITRATLLAERESRIA